MTMFQKKAVQRLKEEKAAADVGADKLLGKLQKSEWSGVIVWGIALVALLVVLWIVFG